MGQANLYLRDKKGFFWNPLQVLMEILSDTTAVADLFLQEQITSVNLRD